LREDITRYSDDDLSLRVFNDESLYYLRHDSDLISILEEYYIFTEEQLQVLSDDLDEDIC